MPPRLKLRTQRAEGCSHRPSSSPCNRSAGGCFVKDRDELEVVWWSSCPETALTSHSTRQPPALDQAALLHSPFGSDGDERREQARASDSLLNQAFRGLDNGANYITMMILFNYLHPIRFKLVFAMSTRN